MSTINYWGDVALCVWRSPNILRPGFNFRPEPKHFCLAYLYYSVIFYSNCIFIQHIKNLKYMYSVFSPTIAQRNYPLHVVN